MCGSARGLSVKWGFIICVDTSLLCGKQDDEKWVWDVYLSSNFCSVLSVLPLSNNVRHIEIGLPKTTI